VLGGKKEKEYFSCNVLVTRAEPKHLEEWKTLKCLRWVHFFLWC